jgi:hypothetical protein
MSRYGIFRVSSNIQAPTLAGSSGICSQFTLRPKKLPSHLDSGYELPLLTI